MKTLLLSLALLLPAGALASLPLRILSPLPSGLTSAARIIGRATANDVTQRVTAQRHRQEKQNTP